MFIDNNFKFSVPAQLEKAANGQWRIKGLASTESIDQQGEILIQKGMDLTHIDKKRGYLNYEHRNDPANLIGTLDGYSKTEKGLFVTGTLFKHHAMAKQIYDIMTSLSESDRGRIGMSIEGSVTERDSKNPKIIKKCLIKNVAITFNPVNSDTYADLSKSQTITQDLMKSLSDSEIDFDTTKTFTSDEVVDLLQKALGIGAGGAEAPNLRTEGDALVTSDMSEDKDSDDTEDLKNDHKAKALIEKAKGEGSKGGKVIGHTSTGKPVYAKAGDKVHVHMPNEKEKIKGVVRTIHTKEMGMGGKELAPEDHMAHVELEEHGRQDVRHPKGHRYFVPAMHGKHNNSNDQIHITPRAEEDTTAKSLKTLGFELFKSNMVSILDSLQKLYPEYSRTEIWESLKDRLETKFPDISDT